MNDETECNHSNRNVVDGSPTQNYRKEVYM